MSTEFAQAMPMTTLKPATQLPGRISKEEFLRDYSDREDGFKYEWNQGFIEKSSNMNQQQSKFYYLLFRFFMKTEAALQGGMLISEVDMNTSTEQMRRPDIAFYLEEQLPKMWGGENQVAPWVTEVISPTDNADKINEKLEEYFQAGVQVVWHIFPASKQVYVYTDVETVTVCRGKTLCSGAPAVPDLQISAEELFA